MSFRFIEVCAGAGGMSTGLMQAGFTPLLLNDNQKDCCQTLEHNHPGIRVVLGSFDEIDFGTFQEVDLDLLTGGVPCQSFSQAGKRLGLDDPRGDLMFKFIHLVHSIRPKVFMIENVKGLLTHNCGQTLAEIIQRINGYNIYFKCLDASKYNVPQKRERVFIVGTRKDLKSVFEFPVEVSTRRILGDVLRDVPPSIGAKYSDEKIALFRRIPQGGCWVNLPDDVQREYLGKSYDSPGGKRGILHRLSMDKPSLTLLCTPSQKQTERCHPLEDRPLTVREYARIQTFEDTYVFTGSMSSQYKQIGNAVPVELARRMGISIWEFLEQNK
jgi:DNA (cytosine-5)-methyltransferase 1